MFLLSGSVSGKPWVLILFVLAGFWLFPISDWYVLFIITRQHGSAAMLVPNCLYQFCVSVCLSVVVLYLNERMYCQTFFDYLVGAST